MYERMLNKQVIPTFEEMVKYCGDNADGFISLNEWVSHEYVTEQEVVFPYGNHYGWCIAHKNKKKLLCNIFPEENSFTVMMRLTNKQFESVYEYTLKYTQKYIDNRYPCGDGGWIHFRITCKDHIDDIKKLLTQTSHLNKCLCTLKIQ